MTASSEVAAGIVGLVIGSFVGVVVDRVPRKESIVSPPSHCVSCSAPIRPYDNIPVLSYLVLRGRCRVCGAHIPPRDAILELGTGILFTLLAWRLDRSGNCLRSACSQRVSWLSRRSTSSTCVSRRHWCMSPPGSGYPCSWWPQLAHTDGLGC